MSRGKITENLVIGDIKYHQRRVGELKKQLKTIREEKERMNKLKQKS